MQLDLIHLMIDVSFLCVRRKNNFFIIVCFGCMWSDHIFYCRHKLIILQHDGLGVFYGIVVVTIIVVMITIIVIIAVLITIIMIIIVIIIVIIVTESPFEVELYPKPCFFHRTNFL